KIPAAATATTCRGAAIEIRDRIGQRGTSLPVGHGDMIGAEIKHRKHGTTRADRNTVAEPLIGIPGSIRVGRDGDAGGQLVAVVYIYRTGQVHDRRRVRGDLEGLMADTPVII